MKKTIAISLVFILLIIGIVSVGATWIRSVGLLSGNAVVFGADASATDRLMASVFNKFYGDRCVVADNTSDDEIQAAIDTCSGTARENVKLYGTFTIDTAIVMESFVTLELEGKVALANSANVNMLTATSETDFEITGGEWDGNKANQSASGLQGFYFTSCTDWSVHDLELHDIYKHSDTQGGNGFFLDSTVRGRVERCYIHDLGNPAVSANGNAIITYNQCLDNHFIDNKIETCDGGIYLFINGAGDYCKNNIVSGNIIKTITRDGISLYNYNDLGDGVDHNVIIGNFFNDCGRDTSHPAIVVGNGGKARWNIVIGNVIEGNTGGGEGITVVSDYNFIANNVLNKIAKCSFFVTGASFNVFTNNVVNDQTAGFDAIRLTTNPCIYNLFTGNILRGGGNGQCGINITDVAHNYNTFSYNIIDNWSLCSIAIGGTAPTGNIFEFNKLYNTETDLYQGLTGVDTTFRSNEGMVIPGDM